MKLLNCAVLLASALLPTIAQASDKPLADTLSAFTNCDSTFFTSLQTYNDAWQALVPLKHHKNASWIAVENRAKDSTNFVPVQSTPQVAGVKLLSYFDQSSDLDELGYYLFWGFIVDGQPELVAQYLKPLLKHPEQLQPLGGTYVRSEIRKGDRWQVIQPMPGAPGTKRLERVLLLEPEGPQGAQTRISCSLQGAVDSASLAEVRPDIPAAEYPQPVPEIDIGDIAVPAELLKSLDLPLLQPKFKSLKYTSATKNGSTRPSSPVSIVIHAEGGLLNKTEIYSDSFQAERLTKADLVQLKSKMIGVGDSRVLLTRKLEIQAPQSWSAGQTLSARTYKEQVPAKPQDEPMDSQMGCTVGQRFPASQVFSSIPGDAIELECDQGGYRTIQAFIEDLGIAITLKSTSPTSQSLYEVTALEVER